VALRDMRLREPIRTVVERLATQDGLHLEDESSPDEYDPQQRRSFTVLRGANVDLALLQIDNWIANDGRNIGALSEAAYAFKGKHVRVLSAGVDDPVTGLEGLLRHWKDDLLIDGEFVPWRHVDGMTRGEYPVSTVFGFGPPRAVQQSTPDTGSHPQVFISYSHKDARWLDRLLVMLKPVSRLFPYKVWNDKEIGAGARWFPEIQQALASARVVLLLVSPSFLASDFIHERELGPAMAAANEDQKKILWVLLSACLWCVFRSIVITDSGAR
jgi:hypothetical protein